MSDLPPEGSAPESKPDAKQQLAKTPKSLLSSLLQGPNFLESLDRVLPSHIRSQQLVRIALTAMNKTPKLFMCTPESICSCLLDLAAMGLSPDGRHAHLIPFEESKTGKVKCTLIVDYKGIIELALRSPSIAAVQAIVVRESDFFKWSNGEIEHIISIENDRGPLKAVYSKVVLLKNGTHFVQFGEPMTKAEIEKIKNRSKAKESGPWLSDFDEMAKKSVIRRDSKYWTLSPEVSSFILKYDEVEFENKPVRKSFSDAIKPAQLEKGNEDNADNI